MTQKPRIASDCQVPDSVANKTQVNCHIKKNTYPIYGIKRGKRGESKKGGKQKDRYNWEGTTATFLVSSLLNTLLLTYS